MRTIIGVLLVLFAVAFLFGCTQPTTTPSQGKNGLTDINASNQNTSSGRNSSQLPPSEAIAACSGKATNDACTFVSNGSTMSGVCNTVPGVMACAPARDGNALTKNPAQDGNGATNSGTDTVNNRSNGNNATMGISIDQAISDEAQLNTLSFGGLGFLTGNFCSDTFLPPGKVADYFGFQYLRDITANGKGHDTDFVTNSAENVLYILNASQKAKIIALAKSQGAMVNEFAYDRYPLMKAFRRQLSGDIPSGTTGLSKEAVMSYSGSLYELDANISIQRAKLYADVLTSLDATQRAYLDAMVKGGFASWDANLPEQVDKVNLTREQSVLEMTYASEMFGWYAGSSNGQMTSQKFGTFDGGVYADTYFCPERQGDYFGGFYIKDAPAIGNAGYTIDERITGEAGQKFVDNLDSTQKPIIVGLIDQQRDAIYSIIEKRKAISTELRKLLSNQSIDESLIYSLANQYGQADGEISYYYATAFSKVGKTITDKQIATFNDIKNISSYPCVDGKSWLYSEQINEPTVRNTDFLFK